jgi:hypothetical protein
VNVDTTSFDVPFGGSIDLTAGPFDSDGGAAISYQWSAPGGDFSDPAARATAFRCAPATGAGPRTISLTARRADCSVSAQLVVICDDVPVDASIDDSSVADAGVDDAEDAADSGDAGAGDGGGSGTGSVCGDDSTIDEGTACNQCTLENCTTLESANTKKDVMPTAGCHHLAADRDRQACEALYCCMRTHRCVVNADPTPCWCGSADPTQCANGTVVADGPCLAETQAAAGTMAQSEIAARFVDPTLAVGGAVNLAICRASFCADPPAPICAGY